MQVLTVLTLVYLAVLVLAVALGLIAIFTYLYQARGSIIEIADGLKTVNSNVEPLGPVLNAANGALLTVLDNLKAVDRDLASVEASRAAGR